MGKTNVVKVAESEEHSDTSSRRVFLARSAGALVSGALIAPLARAGQRQPITVTPKGLLRTRPIKKSCGLAKPIEIHEPPVTISGGSLQIEMEHEIAEYQDIQIPAGNPRRVKRYRLKQGANSYEYGSITKVQVITEYQTVVTDWYYYPGQECSLQIWLQKRSGNGWDTSDTQGVPHLFINIVQDAAGPHLNLEVDGKFPLYESNFKQFRQFRYKHPGYGSNYFRIWRWRMADSNDSTISDFEGWIGKALDNQHPKEMSDGFEIIPYFSHLGFIELGARKHRKTA